MTNNLARQIKDIQNEADKLSQSKPSLVEIRNFQKYSDEMVKYISMNSTNPSVLAKLKEIPKIINLDQDNKKGIFSILVGGPFGFFFHERNAIDQALVIVPRVRAIYSSIEFLMKQE